MKVTGIIAEYNPFHNGHQYHIDRAREMTGADFCIVVMSGDFTQRGEPALIGKYARTQMALSCGADLVLELPVCYACSSAPYFAQGAIALLDKLGVVDHIAFGSECGDIALLQKNARVLAKEPAPYVQAFRSYLKAGLSYPAAQSQALIDYYSQYELSPSEPLEVPKASNASVAPNASKSCHFTSLLSAPNDLLGTAYCQALLSRNSHIQPVAIVRRGSGYSDSALHAKNSSALAIRTALSQQNTLSGIHQQVPPAVYSIMEAQYQKAFPIFPDMLSALLHYQLLREAASDFTEYLDVSRELSDRICNKLPDYTGFSAFCQLLKTKELTYTRISRALLHILLDIKAKELEAYSAHDFIFYGRILGFRQASTALLAAIKANAAVPLISKLADAPSYLGDLGMKQLQKDIQASHIYSACVLQSYGTKLPIEKQRQIIRC